VLCGELNFYHTDLIYVIKVQAIIEMYFMLEGHSLVLFSCFFVNFQLFQKCTNFGYCSHTVHCYFIFCLEIFQEGCQVKFALTSERNKHLEDAHERSIPCNLCDKKFFGKKEAEAHVHRWHMDDGKPKVS
jgi:hypothetical protein